MAKKTVDQAPIQEGDVVRRKGSSEYWIIGHVTAETTKRGRWDGTNGKWVGDDAFWVRWLNTMTGRWERTSRILVDNLVLVPPSDPDYDRAKEQRW